MTDFLRAYTMPEKYAVEIPIEQIVCDDKIDPDYAQHLGEKFKETVSPKPIVVVKHPGKELYAVLDGHHRFWVMKQRGLNRIKVAVVDDYVGLGFELTRSGVLQPPPEFTRYIRVPVKMFLEYIEGFLRS